MRTTSPMVAENFGLGSASVTQKIGTENVAFFLLLEPLCDPKICWKRVSAHPDEGEHDITRPSSRLGGEASLHPTLSVPAAPRSSHLQCSPVASQWTPLFFDKWNTAPLASRQGAPSAWRAQVPKHVKTALLQALREIWFEWVNLKSSLAVVSSQSQQAWLEASSDSTREHWSYSAWPSPRRLMRRTCTAVAARQTGTRTHRRRAPQYLLRSLSDAAMVCSYDFVTWWFVLRSCWQLNT